MKGEQKGEMKQQGMKMDEGMMKQMMDERSCEGKGKSDYYGLSREERFGSCGPRQRYLWRNPQRNKNPGTHCEEVIKGSLQAFDAHTFADIVVSVSITMRMR